ncbi:hypothetical protein INT08_07935 [Prosthecochloris sp. N3]|uniref:Uncharacterized protein n=1 Tax=Prosthecochloris ethylica TaxID=2743976 RepID=A0ABR9XST0_9CHLB|nr:MULTISPECIES: hypothetical protein [Prosthecochloris]MBF0585611.1 hypothetical protein [Prosthecochloris ethylica]MBF0637096.1 hypothetical protein [Prosthecochloris ethylica]NUK46841.1 hypothetical protein [Prosthecochloris ethylica]RNA64586.1 hypothetical protein CR163_004630 [Prosthecochloris sp. ZM_2]
MLDTIKRREELEAKITDLETSLNTLKKQLREEVQKEQHRDIDHLEEYLDEVDHRYGNLRDFWGIVRKELRDFFARRKASDTNGGDSSA